MYHVFFSQRTTEGVTSDTVDYQTLTEAKSRMHTELAQVGIAASLTMVSAMVFTDECSVLATGSESV